jgi:hypothetical protein
MRGPIVLATVLGTMLVVASCSTSYPPCHRGEYQGCVCANGSHGYQQCNVSEDGYLACVCDGTTPGVDGGRDSGLVDATAADASEAAATPGGGQYMMSCGANGACAGAGALCYEFGTKGKVCTKPCMQPSDCPAPSPGCGTNQICRAP